MRKQLLVFSNVSWFLTIWVALSFGQPIWALCAFIMALLSSWYHYTDSRIALWSDTIFAGVYGTAGVWMVIQTGWGNHLVLEVGVVTVAAFLFVYGYRLKKAQRLTAHAIIHSPWHVLSAFLMTLIKYHYFVLS